MIYRLILPNAPSAFIGNYAYKTKMLSIPDFKEKQILFIQPERNAENKIKLSNDNVAFLKGDKTVNQLSCHKIFAIFIIGDITLTSVLVRNCLKSGISIFLLKNNFETYATIGSAADGNYLLRNKQYIFSDDFKLAKFTVKNKILNQLELLRNAKKVNRAEFEKTQAELSAKIDNAKDDKELLGIEGSSTKNFFQTYFKEIDWYKRMPRTKVDHYNVLMDMGYTFLFNYIDSLLRLYGFDTYKGFYHKLFFQRKSLTCDIVEPFRCIIDKQLLKSFHLKQIDEKDFEYSGGRYLLKYDKSQKYSGIFLDAIIDHKENIFLYVKTFYRYMMEKEVDYPVFKIE